eukprot:s2740_g13.t1
MAPRCAKAGAKTRQRNRPPSRFRSGQVNPEFWRPDDPDLGRRLELESAMGGPTYDQSPAGLPLQPSRLATAPVEPALEEEADLGLVTGPFGTPPKPPPSKRQRQAADRRDTSPELVRADNNTTLSDHMGRQQPRSAAASPELLSDAAVQRGSFYVGFQGNTVRQRAMAEPDASSASQHPMIQVAANIPPQEISSDTSCDATSDDSSMSSQGEDETRLQYLRRCSDCLQKQTRRYNRRRRRCKGMQISVSKTVILHSWWGSRVQDVTRPYLLKVQNKRYLRIAMGPDEEIRLPLVDSHKYLGVVLPDKNYEALSLKYRLQQSWIALNRLTKALKNRTLPVRLRLQLYNRLLWTH